jgi:hypothetical protein
LFCSCIKWLLLFSPCSMKQAVLCCFLSSTWRHGSEPCFALWSCPIPRFVNNPSPCTSPDIFKIRALSFNWFFLQSERNGYQIR